MRPGKTGNTIDRKVYFPSMKFNLRLVSMILYTVSLVLPVFYGSDLLGFHALIMGWMSIPAGDICMALPWLSNAGYIALLMIRSRKKGLVVVFPVLIMAAFAAGITEVPRDEGGGNDHVKPGFGFVTWALAYLLIALHFMFKKKD